MWPRLEQQSLVCPSARVVDPDGRVTPLSALLSRARRLSVSPPLAGLPPGARVLVRGGEGADQLAGALACLRRGLCVVGGGAAAVGVEDAVTLDAHVGVVAAGGGEEGSGGAGDEHGDGEAPWALLFTSGTSGGKAKGVPRSANATLRGVAMHQPVLRLGEGDVFLPFWPSYGISTFFFTWYVLLVGGTVVFLPPESSVSFEARVEAVRTMLRTRCKEDPSLAPTFMTGPPSLFATLLLLEKGLGATLRQVLVSGAPCPAVTKVELKRLLPRTTKLHAAYGSTECGLIALLSEEEWWTTSHKDNEEGTLSDAVAADSLGKPAPGVEVRIRKEDSVLMVNPKACPMFMCTSGYETTDLEFANSKRAEEGGGNWFVTGDVVELRDEEGRLGLLGRADDVIQLRGGFKFYPAEVELALLAIRDCGVSDVVVFLGGAGGTTAQDEEVVVCVCVCVRMMNQAGRGVEEEELARRVREAAENLEAYKRPNVVVCVASLDELPLTETRKVRRRDLGKWWAERKLLFLV